MPDGDYLAWRAGAKWRKVANLLKSGASTVEVEDAVVSAVAKFIRAAGGVPDLHAVAGGITEAGAAGYGGGEVVVDRPSASGGVLGRLLDEVVATMQAGMNLVSPTAAAEALAEKLLRRVAEAGLDHIVPLLIAEGQFTMVELRNLINELCQSRPMALLRDRLVRRPSGEGLRAPDRRTSVKPMGELMDTGLDDL
ncbi:hypothetical protein Q5530_31450 [Saccharothrix sp. BKS2]|uniref:hypothetical protein n=1 Tax=Saccharothrix sp. BKS2 TaxID=3064400 RepID=UPI0039EB296A